MSGHVKSMPPVESNALSRGKRAILLIERVMARDLDLGSRPGHGRFSRDGHYEAILLCPPLVSGRVSEFVGRPTAVVLAHRSVLLVG